MFAFINFGPYHCSAFSAEIFPCFSSLSLTEDDLSKLPLGDLALWSLHQICSQDWVRDRCLQVPDDLFSKHILLDPEVKPHQAQSLLRMICHMQVS